MSSSETLSAMPYSFRAEDLLRIGLDSKLAKIGFLALAAEWYWETEMSDSKFTAEARLLVKSIESTLAVLGELVSAGLVTTEESALSAAGRFREANVEAVVACCFMWSEDQPLLRVLEELKETPLLLWSWTPGHQLPESLTALDLIRWSGPVAAQQISGALRRLGRNFTFLLGSHTERETLEEIEDFVAAATTGRGLRHSRIGLIPHRYLVMTNTWVDEFDLMRKLGIDVVYISVNDLRESSRSVEDAEIRTYLDELRDIGVSPEVSSRGLSEAARVSLGLAKKVAELRLDAVSIGDCDDELHALLQCRPCLYLPSVFERNTVVGMEGDLLGIVAQLVLSRLSGQPTMFAEIFTYDQTKNEILVGHAGMHDIRLAKSRSAVTITPDYEYPREEAGVWMAFSVRPGPVTLLSIASTTGGIHFVVTNGEALPSEGRLQGYPNALVRLNTSLKSFFKVTTGVGTTQHWALAPGELRNRVSRLASILGLQCTVIEDD